MHSICQQIGRLQGKVRCHRFNLKETITGHLLIAPSPFWALQ
jgi:hypothetical protein